MRLRAFAACALVAASLFTQAQGAEQSYPAKPVHIVVPFTAGGLVDFQARWAAQKLDTALKSTFVVDNRPGAGGTIAAEMVARAPKDGYTLFAGNPGPLTIAPSTYAKLPYHPLRDFQPITPIAGWASCVCVNPSVPFRNIKELIAYAKRHPGQLTFGTPGIGTLGQFATEYMSSLTGIKMTHVPYKGSVQVNTDLVAGNIDLAWVSIGGAAPLVKAGKLRALAVTSLQRSPLLPDVPTVDEQGIKGFQTFNWSGLLGPAGMPQAIVDRIHTALAQALNAPGVHEYFSKRGYFVLGWGPNHYARFLRDETKRWAAVAKHIGLKPH